MPKGPKGFSELEKSVIKEKLRKECEKSWAVHGYKKTNVGELCEKVGISIGTFYMCFSSKEALFLETLETLQNNLMAFMEETIAKEPTKDGFAKAIKLLYQEYARNIFLYNATSPDFLAFLNKLPQENVLKLKFDNEEFFRKNIESAGLKLLVSDAQAFSVISALLSILNVQDVMRHNHIEVFNFMLDNLIDQLFE
ncbi:TetR/AcrR family transcriptional regulator [Cytobacillus horneckiae]|uniref:TetR/AcrR family transcriptional regulator n=1 Tax=Cytobacillus horneckiae TaxID=549687 RepID=A0A2N0Z8I2_9BACI|nr:TetR/AcrR family transcriptional regulator [Cytobacillus horneckiae]MEC1156007.1 TetR/AcrR family transcriptional regulator [Cytobacillus horneckiae]MED2939717.1 TetR/AcrR family transcriptional regulator [Cytobacillus horneckiae]PKG25823.1 TetR/AcrR family transcriptional regulator [Cytobacillus horneckiae]